MAHAAPRPLELASMRESYDGLLEEGTAPLEDHPDGVQWHTFAGGAVNRLLAAGLEQKSGKKWVAGNLSLRCKDLPVTAAGDAIRALADLDWERVAADAARDMARGMLSKFQPCLPEEAEDRLLAERLLDLPGTLRFLASVKVNGVRVAARPSGDAPRRRRGDRADAARVRRARPRPVHRPRRATRSSGSTRPRRSAPSARSCAPPMSSGSTSRPRSTSERSASFRSRPAKRTYLIDPFAVGDLEADHRRAERHAAAQGDSQRAVRAPRSRGDRHRARRRLRHAGGLSPSSRP